MLRTWISRIRGTLLRRRMDAEFAGEIETHLALLADELVRRGMPRELAGREARRQFGGVTQAQELHREGARAGASGTLVGGSGVRPPHDAAQSRIHCGGGGHSGTRDRGQHGAVFGLQRSGAEAAARGRSGARRPPGAVVRESKSRRYAVRVLLPGVPLPAGARGGFAGLTAASDPVRVFAEARGGAVAERLQGQLVSANYFAVAGVKARGRRGRSRRTRTVHPERIR